MASAVAFWVGAEAIADLLSATDDGPACGSLGYPLAGPAPQLRLEAPIGGGVDWPGYAYIAETVRSLLPMLEQTGMVTPEEADVETLADRLRAEVVHQRGVEMLPIVIGAWTHYKP